MYQFLYTQNALRDLKKIDRKNAHRIVKKVLFFSQQKDPLTHAKKLQGECFGQYRFRVGDYRVLFDIQPNGIITILLIVGVKHRKEAYRL